MKRSNRNTGPQPTNVKKKKKKYYGGMIDL